MQPSFEEIWAVGDNENDVGMLTLADRAWVIDPKSPKVASLPGVREIARFDELTQSLSGQGLGRFLRTKFLNNPA